MLPLNLWAPDSLLVCLSDNMQADAPPSVTLHATCVAVARHGMLIQGASGSGKSALALQLMGFGATLVADDRVQIWRDGSRVMAGAPTGLPELIEARHFGLLKAKLGSPVPLIAVVDLNQLETTRLPGRVHQQFLGLKLPCFRRVDGPHFAPALMQYLKAGALDPDASV